MADVDGGDLAELEAFVGGMLKSLEPAARRSLFRRVATTMRRQNRARIRAQRNPDGSGFAPRIRPAEPEKAKRVLKFLYPSGGSAAARLVLMEDWKRRGAFITGHDIEAGAERTFKREKVMKWLPVDFEDKNKGGGKIRKRRTIRQRAMFRKIGREMQAGQSDFEAWISFSGIVGSIARVHQYGLKDKPSRHAREVRYARRELLGLTADEREELLDTVIDHLMAE